MDEAKTKALWAMRGIVTPVDGASDAQLPVGFVVISFHGEWRSIASMPPVPVYSAAGFQKQGISGMNVHALYVGIADFMRMASVAANVVSSLMFYYRCARRPERTTWKVDIDKLKHAIVSDEESDHG